MFRTLNLFKFATAAKKVPKPNKTLYQILELPKDASSKDIKANYIKLAKVYHPDVYKGADKTRFEKIKEAYETLSNVDKRREYDESIGVKSRAYTADETSKSQTASQQTEETEEGLPKNRKGVKLDYSFEKTEQSAIDLEEEYQKFFGKKVKTQFEEIRIVEEPEFKQMNEAQRIRRRFRQIHNDPMYTVKTIHQKSYTDILKDHISERNETIKQEEEDEKQWQYKQTEEYKKKTKKRVYMLFTGISIFFFPMLISGVTRWRLEREERQVIEQGVQKFQRDQNMQDVNRRFKYG